MLSGTEVVLLAAALQVKHFVADFLYQPPYQWQNKGTYGHPGGIIHSLQHVALTFLIINFFTLSMMTSLLICAVEFIIHYHTDWWKMNYNKKKGWGPTTHEQFWQLLGVDQLIHGLTYVGIMAVLIWM